MLPIWSAALFRRFCFSFCFFVIHLDCGAFPLLLFFRPRRPECGTLAPANCDLLLGVGKSGEKRRSPND